MDITIVHAAGALEAFRAQMARRKGKVEPALNPTLMKPPLKSMVKTHYVYLNQINNKAVSANICLSFDPT